MPQIGNEQAHLKRLPSPECQGEKFIWAEYRRMPGTSQR